MSRLNKLGYIVFLLPDFFIAVLIGVSVFPVSVLVRHLVPVGKPFLGEENILFLSGGSTLEDCYRKFGSFEPLFNYDGVIESFDRVFLFWYPVRNNLTVAFREDYIIHERKKIRFLNLTTHLLLVVEFLFVVKRKSICAIRAFDPYQRGLMAWALSRLSGVPCCVSLHGDYEKSDALQGGVIPRILGGKRIAMWIEKFVYRHINLILPIRESLAAKIRAKGGAPEKIRLFPHGVDLSAFSTPHELDGLEGQEDFYGKRIISVVARLERENYIADVVSIANILKTRRSDVVVLVAGDGRERQNVSAEIVRNGLEGVVVLLGFLPRERVVTLRQNSYLSLCLMGGFSLIEACAAGRPVISYDVEWHYELVHDGETGYLIEEGDISEAVRKIDYLLDHPQIAETMGRKARELAFRRHSMEASARIKDGVYAELLGMGSQPLRLRRSPRR